jgi:ubiquinol-cytochrome c reductase iron-sulfur subunit
LSSDQNDVGRRDFLMVAAGSFAAVGGAAALWPLIDQMNPDASAKALASVEIDLSPIKEGQAITIMWRGKPVFIRKRTATEIEEAQSVDVNDLPDPQADDTRAQKPEWLVLIGICTHLGCIPRGQAAGDLHGDYGGWFCPCHGSHYDTSGRIRKGPAPRNLEVPPYVFVSDSKIKIG